MDSIFDFGARLRQLRIDRNLSQTQAAKLLKLHKSSIYGYENNLRNPSIFVLSQLAGFYGVTTDYLLGHDNKRYICVDKLTDRQFEIIQILLMEFKKNK